jgi:hypothetical protein
MSDIKIAGNVKRKKKAGTSQFLKTGNIFDTFGVIKALNISLL